MATFNPIKTHPTVPIIHQSEAAECGLACLAMVATYYGYETDIRNLRSRFLVSLKGTTLKGLMDIAGKLGLSSRPVRLELDNLSDLSTPAILHWGLNHFVVLVKTSRNYAVLRDPARGSVKLPMDEVSKFFTGIALELRPTPLFEEKKDITPVRITDFWQRIRGLKGSLIKVFVLSLMLQLIALVMPLFQQLVVDDAITKQDVDFLMVLALGFAILGIINLVIGWLRSYLVLYFSTTLNFQMKLNLFRHVLRLPIDFFEKRHMGDITSRFGSINPIANLFTSGFIAIVLDGIMAIGTVIMAFTYSVKLTAIVFLFLLINFFIQLMTMPYLKRKNEEILHLSAKVETNFLESLRAVRAVKLFNQESTRESQWQNLTIDSLNARVTLSKFTINLGVLTGALGVFQSILIMYLSAMMVIEGQLTLGMLFAYQAYSSQFSSRLGALISQFFAFRLLKVHLTRLADIVHTPAEFDDSVSENTSTNYSGDKGLQGDLRLKNISFRYGEQEGWILRNADAQIPPGKMTAVVGQSGGGKTTSLKIMLGLLNPQKGEVMVDGVPLLRYGLSNFRNDIAVVMQDDQLLSGTIADNISFFDSKVNMQFVQYCAKQAFIHNEIVANPMGYDTLIGDMGTTLSGGQKQRVLIARALYRKPKILFLDEGTANLDIATEFKIAHVISRLPITRVVIAHRPALVKLADHVLQVADGQINRVSDVQKAEDGE